MVKGLCRVHQTQRASATGPPRATRGQPEPTQANPTERENVFIHFFRVEAEPGKKRDCWWDLAAWALAECKFRHNPTKKNVLSRIDSNCAKIFEPAPPNFKNVKRRRIKPIFAKKNGIEAAQSYFCKIKIGNNRVEPAESDL